MQVARWGNSLAVRIPVDVVRALGLKEGDDVELRPLDEEAAFALITEAQRREAAVRQMRNLRWALPPGYQFDRDEANAR